MKVLEETKLYTVVYQGSHCQDGYQYCLVSFDDELLCAPMSFLSDQFSDSKNQVLPNIGTSYSIPGWILENFGSAKEQLGIEG